MERVTIPTDASGPRLHLALLDVRAQVARGEHPIAQVRALLTDLGDGGVLEVIAPFEPVPMMAKLRAQGCEVVSGSTVLLRFFGATPFATEAAIALEIAAALWRGRTPLGVRSVPPQLAPLPPLEGST
jgi:hypothetical protein